MDMRQNANYSAKFNPSTNYPFARLYINIWLKRQKNSLMNYSKK